MGLNNTSLFFNTYALISKVSFDINHTPFSPSPFLFPFSHFLTFLFTCNNLLIINDQFLVPNYYHPIYISCLPAL